MIDTKRLTMAENDLSEYIKFLENKYGINFNGAVIKRYSDRYIIDSPNPNWVKEFKQRINESIEK